jgi:large subunit ribosomal protein L7A
MAPDDLRHNRTVGLTQSLRAIEEGKAEKVYLAMDADTDIIDKVKAACEIKGVDIEYAESKRQLGRDGGIDVAAAVICLLKTEK